MAFEEFVLATRRSPLAVCQTELAEAFLQETFPEAKTSQYRVTTTGDRQIAWSLENRGGKGLFTKELEEALLQDAAHIAVHSAKDLPTQAVPGLVLAGFLPRESVADVLASREDARELREIASSSPRRRSQAKKLYPKVCWNEIRGNVDTRLRKVLQGHADATILAAAGLNRLGIQAFEGIEFRAFSVEEMVPAAGQGAIALQCKPELAEILRPHLCAKTTLAVEIERTVLDKLGGGCHTAVGVHFDGDCLHVYHEDIGRISEVLTKKDWDQPGGSLEKFMERYFAKKE